MADYMRKIIYLRKMEKGISMPNGGFVRLEKRNDTLLVYLVTEGKGAISEQPVYAVYERNHILYPLLLGTTGAESSWKFSCPFSHMADDRITDEICGFLVGGPERYLAGSCPEYKGEITFENVQFAREKEAEQKAPSVEITDRAIPAEEIKAEETAVEEEAAEKADNIEVKAVDESVLEEEEPSGEEMAGGEPEEEAEAASLDELLPGQEPAKARDPLFAKLKEMYPFEDDEMEWCVQMEPSDFSSFPMEFWHYSKNSFLLQGFYNYRHLLYAHSKEKNYVGVPGQFHRREQYLAGQFGFPRFKGTQKKRVTVGDFGYWLKEL